MGSVPRSISSTLSEMPRMLLLVALPATVPVRGEDKPVRILDEFTTNSMKEDGVLKAAAPECKDGLVWVYYNGHCYMFTSYHVDYLKSEELCNEHGAYLADILDQAESDFIKTVLNAVNPKDGTDYWLGGLDADRDKGLQWITGQPMAFTDFKDDKEPAGNPYLHMSFDAQFKWDTKDDANDKDNGFICKKAHA